METSIHNVSRLLIAKTEDGRMRVRVEFTDHRKNKCEFDLQLFGEPSIVETTNDAILLHDI